MRTGLTRVPQTLVVSPSAAEVAASTLAAATAGLPHTSSRHASVRAPSSMRSGSATTAADEFKTRALFGSHLRR